MKLISAYLLYVLTASCNNSPTRDAILKQIDSTSQPAITSPANDTIYANEGDSTIRLTNQQVFIKGHLTANKHQPVYTIQVTKGQTITATIKPLEKRGNVRINQIKKPDGSFDGPFGDSLSYQVKSTGNISFLIGENLMAGDPWTGYFILCLKVK